MTKKSKDYANKVLTLDPLSERLHAAGFTGGASKSLLKKNEIIVLNKIDLIDKKNLDSKKKILSGKIKKKIYDLSTLDKSKISKIKSKLLEYVF